MTVTDVMRQRASKEGLDPADLDRCLACEQYASLRSAHNAGSVISLEQFEQMRRLAGRIHGPHLLLEARILRVVSDAWIYAKSQLKEITDGRASTATTRLDHSTCLTPGFLHLIPELCNLDGCPERALCPRWSSDARSGTTKACVPSPRAPDPRCL